MQLSQQFEYISNLGQGSQAKVDVYSKKSSSATDEKCAIKTYLVSKGEEEKKMKVIRAITNEVKYLRELYACENIITLDSVYRTLEGYHLVLRYAEHGCLRNHIIKEDLISE